VREREEKREGGGMDALSSNQQAPSPPPSKVNRKVIQGACQTLNGLGSMHADSEESSWLCPPVILKCLPGRARCHAQCEPNGSQRSDPGESYGEPKGGP
jgi:hypothetical protein